jgi:hypothetical protein
MVISARHTFSALVLILLATGCTKKSHEKVDLRTRIAAANPSQYCHSPNACFNPHILVVENGYFVSVFVGDKAHNSPVSTKALGDYLTALPIIDWPLGPTIGISPSDDVMESQAIQKNLDEARRTCRSLGLEVQFRPGG